MSPPSLSPVASSSSSSSSSSLSYLAPFSAAIASVAEVSIFLPWDTVSKRLQTHQQRVVDIRDLKGTRDRFNNVVFGADAAQKKPLKVKMAKLYPGYSLFWGIAHRIGGRTVKFGGQPLVKEQLKEREYDRFFTNTFGKRTGKVAMDASCGAFVSVFEIAFLSFDRMKILNQTKLDYVKDKSFVSLLKEEGVASFYRGANVTIVRNLIGTSALFGGSAFVKETAFHLEDYNKASFVQNFIASSFGSVLGVTLTSPNDVMKTRLQQSTGSAKKKSALELIRTILKEEGVNTFFKGIGPKIITVAPRLVFSHVLSSELTKFFRGTK